MSFKTLFILVPVLSLAALTGCKASCEGLCDDAKDADCSTTDTVTINGYTVPKSSFDHANCIAGCQIQEDMEADDVTDCSDEFDSLTSCISDQSDICKAFQADDIDESTGLIKPKKCGSEYVDYVKCYADYCKDHSKRDYCN